MSTHVYMGVHVYEYVQKVLEPAKLTIIYYMYIPTTVHVPVYSHFPTT